MITPQVSGGRLPQWSNRMPTRQASTNQTPAAPQQQWLESLPEHGSVNQAAPAAPHRFPDKLLPEKDWPGQAAWAGERQGIQAFPGISRIRPWIIRQSSGHSRPECLAIERLESRQVLSAVTAELVLSLMVDVGDTGSDHLDTNWQESEAAQSAEVDVAFVENSLQDFSSEPVFSQGILAQDTPGHAFLGHPSSPGGCSAQAGSGQADSAGGCQTALGGLPVLLAGSLFEVLSFSEDHQPAGAPLGSDPLGADQFHDSVAWVSGYSGLQAPTTTHTLFSNREWETQPGPESTFSLRTATSSPSGVAPQTEREVGNGPSQPTAEAKKGEPSASENLPSIEGGWIPPQSARYSPPGDGALSVLGGSGTGTSGTRTSGPGDRGLGASDLGVSEVGLTRSERGPSTASQPSFGVPPLDVETAPNAKTPISFLSPQPDLGGQASEALTAGVQSEGGFTLPALSLGAEREIVLGRVNNRPSLAGQLDPAPSSWLLTDLSPPLRGTRAASQVFELDLSPGPSLGTLLGAGWGRELGKDSNLLAEPLDGPFQQRLFTEMDLQTDILASSGASSWLVETFTPSSFQAESTVSTADLAIVDGLAVEAHSDHFPPKPSGGQPALAATVRADHQLIDRLFSEFGQDPDLPVQQHAVAQGGQTRHAGQDLWRRQAQGSKARSTQAEFSDPLSTSCLANLEFAAAGSLSSQLLTAAPLLPLLPIPLLLGSTALRTRWRRRSENS